MSTMVNFDQFKQMVADHFGFKTEQLLHATSFIDDLGIDSLSLVNFVIKLERKYGIKIEMDSVWQLKSIGEAFEIFIQKYTAGKSPVRPAEIKHTRHNTDGLLSGQDGVTP
jgi:acyl carrier protein